MSFAAFLDAFAPLTILGMALFMMAGGFVKGAVGFALPMVAVSGISSIASPQDAIAAIIIPAFFANIWQAGRQGLGPALQTAKEHWKLNLVLAITIAIVAQAVPYMPTKIFFILLGVIVSAVAIIQLMGLVLPTPKGKGQRTVFEVVMGFFAGAMGGLGGFWGPATVMYLIALGTEKQQMIRAQGLTYFIGSMMLVGGHLTSGVLNEATLPLSFLMLAPAAVGMVLGTMLQDRLNPVAFKRLVLVVLCVAGLNLLRRGLF
ncbi:MAG: sulfite exporter TauE/SafE family protein [Alphaproteobacteria bacterium]|nr:sulfite exporter TauE/SafE family protein [Alphaproteobacteria bacterium SS10]